MPMSWRKAARLRRYNRLLAKRLARRGIPQEYLESWTEKPDRYWFRRCDMCKRRQPFWLLHECYSNLPGFGWWFGCCKCVARKERP